MKKYKPDNPDKAEAFAELERGVHSALETYSNVHRGSGNNSMITTRLYEEARSIILDHLDLDKGRYQVIFCTPRRAAALMAKLNPKSYRSLSGEDTGLPLGVTALAVKKSALSKGVPAVTGGGTTRLVAPDWVIWAGLPDRFEAGTPAIINVIAFARALQLLMNSGAGLFRDGTAEKKTVSEILYHDELDQFSGRELLEKLVQTLIGRGVQIQTPDGLKPFINLDYGASTPTFAPVWEAVRQTWRQHRSVQQEIIQEVRSVCAGMLGAPPEVYDLIYTANTTEAINLAAESFGRESEPGIEPVVLGTILEHSSNDLPWRKVPGHSHIRLMADREGFIDVKELESVLSAYNREEVHGKKRIRLVAVSGASNVLGTCNDLAEISRIVHQYRARLLVDAAQLVAHRRIDMEACGIDYLAFSAHKVYAPFGTGALVVKKGLLCFTPEEMELIRSSGEENTGGIAALGKALVLLKRIGFEVIREEEQALTARALRGMAKVPGLRIFGVTDPGSPRFARRGGVIVFEIKGLLSGKVAGELAGKGGIGVRYGCHCAHLLIKHLLGVSPRLERFQRVILTLFPKVRLPGLVRVSMGIGNTPGDIDALISELNRIAVNTK